MKRRRNPSKFTGVDTGINATDIYNSGSGVTSNWLPLDGNNQITANLYFTQGSGASAITVTADLCADDSATAARAIPVQEGDASAPPAIAMAQRSWTYAPSGTENMNLNFPVQDGYKWVRFSVTASGGSAGEDDVAELEVIVGDI